MNRRKKVLVIAGGGVYGCIPAHFLASLPVIEQDLNKIDLIAGCSIGGILTAAYVAGKSFNAVDKTFRQRADECFDKRWGAYINPIACPTYKNSSLNTVIKDMVGDKLLGDVRKQYPNLDVIIPSLNITDDCYKVFDNITGQDDDVPLATIASITSAAPSYYSGIEHNGKCFVDGGLIEVAPLLTATTALKSKRKVPFKDMDVLMLGTGRDVDEDPLTPKRYNSLSLLGMANEVIVPYVTLSNEMATRYWGSNIGYNSFEYFNPCFTNGKLDDVDQIPDMVDQSELFLEEFHDAWYKWLHREELEDFING